MADDLRVANENLAKLNATKDKFFSIVAHDLRGPFQPLLTWTEMFPTLIKNSSPQKLEDVSNRIHQSAKLVYRLLENLLQWSRMLRCMLDRSS